MLDDDKKKIMVITFNIYIIINKIYITKFLYILATENFITNS